MTIPTDAPRRETTADAIDALMKDPVFAKLSAAEEVLPPEQAIEPRSVHMHERDAARAPPAAEPPAPKAPEKAAEPAKSPEPPKDDTPPGIKKSFEKLAQEKAEVRKAADEVKAYREASQGLSPADLQAIARAKMSRDPLAALRALGFSYADVASKVVEGRPAKAPPAAREEPAAEEPPAPLPELEEIKSELAELRAERAARQAQETRTRVRETIGDKYPLTKEFGAEAEVLGYLENYYNTQLQKTGVGDLPAATFEENVQIAAEAVEQKYAAQKAKWERILSKNLTAAPGGAKIPPEAPATSARPTGQANPTLTNAMDAPRHIVASDPQSKKEIIDDLLKDPNFMS